MTDEGISDKISPANDDFTMKQFFLKKPFLFLILFLPLAIISELFHWNAGWIFGFSALAIIPLAGLIGEATENLAYYAGPRLGGLLNATFGNAAELIITIAAIRQGLLELVKASLTGSILGNLLLVLGMAMFVGGIRNKNQHFDNRAASRNAIMLVLTVLILLVPSLLSHYIGVTNPQPSPKVETLSLGVAMIMVILYILNLLFGYWTTEADSENADNLDFGDSKDVWQKNTAIIILLLATIGIAAMSELLVQTIEPMIQSIGLSEFFIGIIFIPIIGNVAEHLVAIQMAYKNRMTLSVEIAISSSLQIALFVAPILIFISLWLGHPLTLIFNQFELLALIAGVLITALVSEDGESNWFEGAELLAVYLVLGLAFFLL